MTHTILGPSRIVCLTEETAEWLYLLGQENIPKLTVNQGSVIAISYNFCIV